MKRRPSSWYRQSAVVPYRVDEDRVEILLITSRRGRRWIVPKGIVEHQLTAAESAAREAYEEAGVLGTVAPDPIGEYEYEKWGGVCAVTVFAMKVHTVLGEWPEAGTRERRWMPIREAARTVKKDLRPFLLEVADVQV
jgi:8-oxo-dGTP pyrophosphatase MutT (NUDIX family)